jgi:putative CocE/NonD family hydrolase
MDRWLKEEQNGIDKEPMVKVWFETRDLAGDSKPGWTWTFSNWPVPEAQWHTLYLTADGQLRQEKPGAEKDNGKRSYTFPSGTELVGSNVQFASPPDTSGALTYRTPAMDEDTTILGSPLLTFHASAEHKDTDFMVALHDISPSGDTLYLQRGFLRASLRAVDAARSTPHYLSRPYNKVEELIPGQIYEMKISIPPLGHVVRRGHALELVIMAPSPTPQPDWGLLPVELPGVNSVYHSSAYPSNLMLPVVPGRKAEASAPSCGTLEMQPCRPAPRTATSTQR